jgi:hypothetical protein
MPATRQLHEFDAINQEGKPVKVQRRCFGGGKEIQRQLLGLVYDEAARKFRAPTDEQRRARQKASADRVHD